MEEGGAAACLSTLDKAVRTQGAASYSKGCVHALFCKACIPSLFGAPQTKMRQKFIVTAKALASLGQYHLQNSRLVCTWWSDGFTYTHGNPTMGGLKPWH